MKRAITATAIILALSLLAGCGSSTATTPEAPQRDVSTPSKALIGHWKCLGQDNLEMYYNGTVKTNYHTDTGQVMSYWYAVTNEDPDTGFIRLEVNFDTGAIFNDLRVYEDGNKFDLYNRDNLNEVLTTYQYLGPETSP